ncbi:ProQ/FINO family protein [Halomonas sp. HP20-15]|uniref:ProQ/FINO family protein n=1 Tax=Halomonas sp. HP20-15 TaxID=3085901 RepID=UPI002980A2FB|nr:ProQ/FINO family protein [Halomonas sp. HP20-15]MDW5377413.1 ProQ/FINO family protein [Halomonas sp. HP20-15]
MTTQRVAALFDSLEQHVRRERQEVVSLRQRLARLESENQQLRHSLAKRAEPAETSDATESPVQASHVERGYPLPRRVMSPAPTPEPVTEAERGSSDALVEEPGSQSRLAIGEAPSPQALLDEWYRRYTDTFFKGHTRPLKIGIHEDLVANEPWSDKLVRRALACYVNLPRYLKAVRAGAERVDLAGQPAGAVTPGEARHAHKKLEALQAQQRKRDKTLKREERQNQSARLDRKLGDLLAKHGKH